MCALVTPVIALLAAAPSASANCAQPQNPIEAENCQPGNPPNEWDVAAAGDLTIQGFADDINYDVGSIVNFKVNTTAALYRLDIYRMGYYGGLGARKVATIMPSVPLPQTQPTCLTDSTGLVDCGNWAISAFWAIPTNATSGIYFARLVRLDTMGASHVFFIVRNDASHSDLLVQISDLTWQAYNGTTNLYECTGSEDINSAASSKSAITGRSRRASKILTPGSSTPSIRWSVG